MRLFVMIMSFLYWACVMKREPNEKPSADDASDFLSFIDSVLTKKNALLSGYVVDYDNEEVRWWMREIEHVVQVKQSEWEEVTVESLTRELYDRYKLSGTAKSEELLEMCGNYLRRYNDPFDGLGDVDLHFLTERCKKALFIAVTAKRERLKLHTAELDAFLKQMQQGSSARVTG